MADFLAAIKLAFIEIIALIGTSFDAAFEGSSSIFKLIGPWKSLDLLRLQWSKVPCILLEKVERIIPLNKYLYKYCKPKLINKNFCNTTQKAVSIQYVHRPLTILKINLKLKLGSQNHSLCLDHGCKRNWELHIC
jgi:hypothetical protein